VVAPHNKSLKQENLQLAVFTAFNILANYKFPLNEALAVSRSLVQNFTSQYFNDDTNLSLVIENNGESIWAYLIDENQELLKDVFLLSPIEPLEELDEVSIKNGNPPSLIKSVASKLAYQPIVLETDFSVVWSPSCNSVLVNFKNSALAAIYNNQESGYSKSLQTSSGFGEPWSQKFAESVF